MATGGAFYESLYNRGRPARGSGAPRPTSEEQAIAAVVRAGPMQVLTAGGPRPTKNDAMVQRGIRGVAVMQPGGTFSETVPAGGGYDLASPYTMPGGGSSSGKRPGALEQKAKAAGMTVEAFARKHERDPGVTGSDSRFYLRAVAKASPAKRTKRGASSAESTARGRVGEHSGLPY